MKNLKIWITVGLQASGKTTWANQKVGEGQGNIVNVNKDDLRSMLHDNNHSKAREALVLKMQEALIDASLSEGKSVIVSDTNLNPIHIQRITDLFGSRAEIIIEDQFLQVPLSECIKRDAMRLKPVGEKAIRDTYNRWLREKMKPVPIEYNSKKQDCVVFDIDGTLTLGPFNRSPFEWSKVGQDHVNKPVADILKMYHYNEGVDVVIVSGRDGSCEKETSDWLYDNRLYFKELFMRRAGDNRPDDIVKEEILDHLILPSYNILAWFDDRMKVCKMLYRRGVPLFRVGDPEGDF